MYDTATDQAWLADGASALLHVVRTQMAQGPYGGESSLFNNMKHNSVKFAHPLPGGGSDATLCALKNEHNLKHKVLREFESYADEKIFGGRVTASASSSIVTPNDKSQSSSEGCKEVYKTTSFRELVSQTWSTFEQIHDRQVEEVTSHSTKQLQTPFRNVLQGYEFMGLVTARHSLTRRAINLRDGGDAWLPLVERIHAIVLFGKHFGDLYRHKDVTKPQLCKQWRTVPRGQQYLVSPLSLLRTIRQHNVREGEIDELSHDIAEGFSWSPSKDAFKTCDPDCNHIMLGRVQKPSKNGKQRLEGPMFDSCPPNGAVIFGDNSILNVHKMQQPYLTVIHPEGDMHDSGLGASIPTSSNPHTPDPSWTEPSSDLEASLSTTAPASAPSEIAGSEDSVQSSAGSGARQVLPFQSDAHHRQDSAAQPNITPKQRNTFISPKKKQPRESFSVVWRKVKVAVRRHQSSSSTATNSSA
jgi:hypothetical protein